MKKILSLLAIMMMVVMNGWAIEPVQPTEGNGEAATPYKIGSAANLVWFAQQVNGGQTAICALLTADIDLGDDQTMIGKGKNYAGTFDGDGHTVTVNYTATANNAALFCTVGNATIKNLKTAGTVSSGYKFAAGMVAIVSGTANITGCASSVTVESTYTTATDATHGGIVAYNGASGVSHLTNVLFNGKLLGEKATNCGGLIGYANSGASTITNCLFNPSEVTVSSTGACTLARGTNVTVTNSYYSTAMGTAQGTQATSAKLASGEVCYNLNEGEIGGTQAWYQNIDHNTSSKDAAPVLDKTHSTVRHNLVSNKYTNHTEKASYSADGEMYCSACGNFMYHQEPGTDAAGIYLIGNKGNLCWFANAVNGGQTTINGKLTTDVSLDSNNNMIGTSTNKYKGTFDGDGHTVTVNYSLAEQYAALFRYVNGATICNLRTAGTITASKRGAAGIAAYCEGTTNISKCASSVTIQSNMGKTENAYHGGIVSYSNGNTTVTYALFNGKFLGAGDCCGGMVGFSMGSTTLNGCWFRPTEVNLSTFASWTMGSGNGITVNNCYYSTLLHQANGTAVTEGMIASGELCYKLNGEKTDGTQAWFQNIDNGQTVDAEPLFCATTHGTVYANGESYCPAKAYSNTHKAHDFSTMVDGAKHCTECGYIAYQAAEQDESGTTYLIDNKGKLAWFAKKVSEGSVAINGKLTANVDLGSDQTMIGTSAKKYAGTFDGDGHTVTVNYTATENNTALFRYVEGATIKKLTTAGSITTGYKFAGGIVSESHGTTNITGCASSVAITSTFTAEQDGTHGGIVGNNQGVVKLTNVLFNGKMVGEKATKCGGLVGWAESKATLTGCWFRPSEVTMSNTEAKTLARGNGVTLNGCFYSTLLGEAQGTATTAQTLASGEVCYKLNCETTDGSQAWYQNIDNGQTADAAPVTDSSHGTVFFAGRDYCPMNTYGNSLHSHNLKTEAGIIVCQAEGCGYVDYVQPEKEDEVYKIANLGNLIWFANSVAAGNTGIDGKLIANLNLGSSQVMIGTSEKMYAGTFDGNGNSVTVHYEASESNAALFRYVNGATIRNLRTKGYINTQYQAAGGIVARSEGTTTIERCVSGVTITSTFTSEQDGTHGGIVANNQGTITLSDVLFNGQLLGANATSCGGLIGWSKNNATIKNCLFYPAATVTFSTSESQTLSRGSNVTVVNSYYTTALGGAQGTQVAESVVADGSLVASLGHSVWVQDDANQMPIPFRILRTDLKDIFDKYLKMTAQGDGTITITKTGTVAATLKYMTDGSTQWTDLAYNTPIALTKGQSIWLCAKGVNGKNATFGGDGNRLTFTSTMDVAASQNIMSLLDASCQQTEVPALGFYKLFADWSHLTEAPKLPATVLNTLCYGSMFENCTKLTSIPDISQATVADSYTKSACAYMFKGCSNLRVNTLGLGKEWKITMSDEYGTGSMNHNAYMMFFETGGNFQFTPEKNVTYYVYDNEPYTRTMDNEWGTICLPFAVAIGSDESCKFYELTDVTSSQLTLTQIADTLAAGTPAFVRRGAGVTEISVNPCGTEFVESPVSGTAIKGLTLTGSFTTKEVTNASAYIIKNDAFWNVGTLKTDDDIWKDAGGSTLPAADRRVYCAPLRAYLEGTLSNGAKKLNIGIGEGGATAVEEVMETLNSSDASEIFDLNGRRQTRLQEGVNIVKLSNGKTVKVIVK